MCSGCGACMLCSYLDVSVRSIADRAGITGSEMWFFGCLHAASTW